jgi:hypothetical protein
MQLLAAPASSSGLDVKLAQVTQLDCAGLQLILALEREASNRRIPIRCKDPSPAIRHALLGELQTVIAPQTVVFGALQGVAGSNGIGGGEFALITIVPALISKATHEQHRGSASASTRFVPDTTSTHHGTPAPSADD